MNDGGAVGQRRKADGIWDMKKKKTGMEQASNNWVMLCI